MRARAQRNKDNTFSPLGKLQEWSEKMDARLLLEEDEEHEELVVRALGGFIASCHFPISIAYTTTVL